MKAMCIDENRNFIWRDVPDPVCHGEFDVKLRVKACALNRADLMQRAHRHGLQPSDVDLLGSDQS